MTTFQFSGPERRRSVRTQLVVLVHVHGQTRTGEEIATEAETHTVSDSGCLFCIEGNLAEDQALILSNTKTGHSIQGKVVSAWRHPSGKMFVGFEFASPAEDFWLAEITISQKRNPPQPKV